MARGLPGSWFTAACFACSPWGPDGPAAPPVPCDDWQVVEARRDALAHEARTRLHAEIALRGLHPVAVHAVRWQQLGEVDEATGGVWTQVGGHGRYATGCGRPEPPNVALDPGTRVLRNVEPIAVTTAVESRVQCAGCGQPCGGGESPEGIYAVVVPRGQRYDPQPLRIEVDQVERQVDARHDPDLRCDPVP